MANKKEYRFEISVSRGWGGVEQIVIAAGTDNEKELTDLVNKMAGAMQDRADEHQRQLRAVEDQMRRNSEVIQAETDSEPAEEE